MERVQTKLFIGGELDGQRKDLPNGMSDCVRFPRYIPQPITVDTDQAARFDYVQYTRQKLVADDTVFEVYVLDGMSMRFALESLLANYRPEVAVTR